MKILPWITLMAAALGTTAPVFSAEAPAAPAAVTNAVMQPALPDVAPAVAPTIIPGAPVRNVTLAFQDIAPAPGAMTLRGFQPNGQIEFGVRGDEVVTQATLNLEFTPSPSLIPVESHLKIYLNDQLVGVATISKEQLGKSNRIRMDIDPRYITDFNRLKMQLIGHYRNICENPANSEIWVDIGKSSALILRYQRLPLQNELSHFPEPFFDSRDNRPLVLPMVFAGSPDAEQQRAAAILS